MHVEFKTRFSTDISLYLGNDKELGCYGTPIGTPMRSNRKVPFPVTFKGQFSIVVTSCAQLMRDLLAIAEFLVRFFQVLSYAYYLYYLCSFLCLRQARLAGRGIMFWGLLHLVQ